MKVWCSTLLVFFSIACVNFSAFGAAIPISNLEDRLQTIPASSSLKTVLAGQVQSLNALAQAAENSLTKGLPKFEDVVTIASSFQLLNETWLAAVTKKNRSTANRWLNGLASPSALEKKYILEQAIVEWRAMSTRLASRVERQYWNQ